VDFVAVSDLVRVPKAPAPPEKAAVGRDD